MLTVPGQAFFWLGLAAVAFFFLGAVLLLISFFAATDAGRRRLAQSQTVACAVLLALTAGAAMLLRERIAVFAGPRPPDTASAVAGAQRELLSQILLGLSLTMNALLCAFAWVRLGRAGNAFRALVWVLPAVRLVLGAVGLMAALGGGPGAADFAGAYAAAVRGVAVSTIAGAALCLLSLPLGWMIHRFGPAAPAGADGGR